MARKWWTLTAVCTGVFMLLLDITIVNVALPSIERAFGATLSDLQWVIDAYALTLAALLLTAGSIADLAGRRVVFAIGIVVFTVGSTLCGVAQDTLFLTLSRALQGVGGAIMFATALALLAQAFEPKERGVAFGVFGAITGIAVAVGPVLGGAITSGLNWRWIFFVNVPIGIFALVVTLLRVEESKLPGAPRPDWFGFVTFSLALAGLVLGLIRSQADGWGSAVVLGSLIASGVLLVAFVVTEMRVREPMFDLSLLRVPTFNGGLIAAWAISASLFSLLTYLVIYMQNLLGYSAIDAGLRFLPLTGGIFVIAGIAGRLTTRVPIKYPDRHRVRAAHRRPAADARPDPDRKLDPLPARVHRRRRRGRADQRPARFDRGRGRASGARRDGFGRQLDAPAGRDRDRCGGVRDDPRLPDQGPSRNAPQQRTARRPRARAGDRDRVWRPAPSDRRSRAAEPGPAGRRCPRELRARPQHDRVDRRRGRVRGDDPELRADPPARLHRAPRRPRQRRRSGGSRSSASCAAQRRRVPAAVR